MAEMVAERTRPRAVRPAGTLAGGLPCRAPRAPWARALVPAEGARGSEEVTCSKLLRAVPRDVLIDCFPLRKEHWFKRAACGSCSA